MTPRQMDLAREAHREFMSVRLPAKRPLDDRDLTAFLNGKGLVHTSINILGETVSGFTRQGMKTLSTLADDFRMGRAHGARLVSRRTLAKTLAQVAIAQWKDRAPGELSDPELVKFGSEIADWFDRQDRVRIHYVPCNMSTWPMPPFTVGPVSFFPLHEFPVADFGLDREEVWPNEGKQRSLMAESYLNEGIFRLAQMRNAETIAEVAVPGREAGRSALTADIAVDVALSIFQLLMPPGLFGRAARATARSAPVWSARLSRDDSGISPATQNDEPGRVLVPGGVAEILTMQADALASTGRRLQAYLDGSGPLPTLDEAWCNAAYWYHEALAEPLETVAIAKFETAIEVLFRAENSSGSKKRLLLGLEAFFGVGKDANLRGGMTADQFAASIVTSRSRVLHGTWPTLHTELPDGNGGIRVSVNDAEALARMLLLRFSMAVDQYAAAGEVEDTVEAFLGWQVRTLTASG